MKLTNSVFIATTEQAIGRWRVGHPPPAGSYRIVNGGRSNFSRKSVLLQKPVRTHLFFLSVTTH